MSCKKCQHDKCTCVNLDCKPVDAKCVLYNGENLNCIADIKPGTSVSAILELWDEYFCGLFDSPVLDCAREILDIPSQYDTLSNTRLLTYIQNWICNLQDVYVKAGPGDTTSGYLIDKISTGLCVDKALRVEDGVTTVHISLDFGCIAKQLPLCFNIEPAPCFEVIGGGGGECVPQPLVPVITRSGLTLSGTNCNGTLQWYNELNVLIGTGSSIVVEGNKKYYAKCQTQCGLSDTSAVITVPPITTYTKTRTATFTRNNCGVNECFVACSGSSLTFTKTYTSTISQADADAKAETDVTFALDGQAKANTTGTCTCFDCNCEFPTFNPTIIVNDATCNGSVVSATGQITIGGITNATRFGYSIGQGDYAGVSYASATPMTNFASANLEVTSSTIKLKALTIETRIVFRLYNGNNNCYTDIVVTHTPPDCTKEQVNIGDITVSCEVTEEVCKNWSIVAGSTVSKVVYYNCNTQRYVFEDQPANTTATRCSTIKPDATGAVVTEIGLC